MRQRILWSQIRQCGHTACSRCMVLALNTRRSCFICRAPADLQSVDPVEAEGDGDSIASDSSDSFHLDILFEETPSPSLFSEWTDGPLPASDLREVEAQLNDEQNRERQINEAPTKKALAYACMYKAKVRDCLRIAYTFDLTTRQLNAIIDSLLNILYWADAESVRELYRRFVGEDEIVAPVGINHYVSANSYRLYDPFRLALESRADTSMDNHVWMSHEQAEADLRSDYTDAREELRRWTATSRSYIASYNVLNARIVSTRSSTSSVRRVHGAPFNRQVSRQPRDQRLQQQQRSQQQQQQQRQHQPRQRRRIVPPSQQQQRAQPQQHQQRRQQTRQQNRRRQPQQQQQQRRQEPQRHLHGVRVPQARDQRVRLQQEERQSSVSGARSGVRRRGEALPRAPWTEARRSAAQRDDERALRDDGWEPLIELVDLSPPSTPRFDHEAMAAAAVSTVRTVSVTTAHLGHEDVAAHVQQMDYNFFRQDVDRFIARTEEEEYVHREYGDLPSLEEVLEDLRIQ